MALAGSLLLSLANERLTTPKVKVERGNISPLTGQTCHSMTKSVGLELMPSLENFHVMSFLINAFLLT